MALLRGVWSTDKLRARASAPARPVLAAERVTGSLRG
jgi:hypothetical protein